MERFDISMPIGSIYLEVEAERIIKIGFSDKEPYLGSLPLSVAIAKQELTEYFRGRRIEFSFPYKLIAQGLKKRVLETLLTVPYGHTISYSELAKLAGYPKAARSIGTACKNNPLPFLFPCHRVIRSSGEPGRYAGSTALKSKLISMEKRGHI